MDFTDQQIAQLVQQYMLPFIRIGSLLMVMPVIGTRVVSARVRLTSAFVITLIVVPLLPPLGIQQPLSLQTLLYGVQEMAVGVSLGFAFQVIFHVFVLAGQYMAMKMGLGFASMNDPTNGVQTTVISQYFLILVTVLFVCSNGHLILIEMLVNSFQTFQPTRFRFQPDTAFRIVELGSWLFASALVIALPVLTSLLVINIAFGVMSRAAPQLNIFAVGFPFTLICGLALIWLGLQSFMVNYNTVFVEGFEFARELVE